jgi:hypothetical protein
MDLRLSMELCFPPEWDRIDTIREAVALSVSAVFGEVDFRDSIAMASAELLENAVKYGSTDARVVKLAIQQQLGAVTIVVTNTVDPDAGHVHALRAAVQWLANFEDPAEAYMAAMARVYDSPDPTSCESGLGLARIAYEADCKLECESEGQTVTVRARYCARETGLRETGKCEDSQVPVSMVEEL